MENGSKEVFAKNLAHYMEITGVSRNDLCKALGLKYTTVRDWLKALSYPRVDKMDALAEYFGISKAFLTEDHGELKKIVIAPNKAFIESIADSLPTPKPPQVVDLIIQDYLEKATEDQKYEILRYIKFILNSDTDNH